MLYYQKLLIVTYLVLNFKVKVCNFMFCLYLLNHLICLKSCGITMLYYYTIVGKINQDSDKLWGDKTKLPIYANFKFYFSANPLTLSKEKGN